MTTFKDYLESDLDVFFNSYEFAEIHNIDGEDMLVVVDNDLIEERQKGNQQSFNDPAGVFKTDVLFIVKKTDFGEKPATGQTLEFDGKRYTVSDVEDEGNTYNISLVGYNS